MSRSGLSDPTSFRVLVVADGAPPEVIPACVDGAAFAGAHLVILVPEQAAPPDGLPTDTTVLATPADDEGAFAALVGAYAAPWTQELGSAEAFQAALGGVGGSRCLMSPRSTRTVGHLARLSARAYAIPL